MCGAMVAHILSAGIGRLFRKEYLANVCNKNENRKPARQDNTLNFPLLHRR
jgi:hypothetical protein